MRTKVPALPILMAAVFLAACGGGGGGGENVVPGPPVVGPPVPALPDPATAPALKTVIAGRFGVTDYRSERTRRCSRGT